MASLLDIQYLRIINNRAHIAVLIRSLGKRQETIHAGDEVGIDLNLRDILLHGSNQLIEESCLQNQDLLIGTENLLLVFLEFLGNISLGLRQRLLADPLLRHLVLEGVAHFQIITEYIIISHLQTADARLLYFPLLNLQKIILAMTADGTQIVEFCIITIGYHIPLVDKLRRIRLNLPGDALFQGFAYVELLAHSLQGIVLGMLASHLDGLDGFKCILQLHHFSRRYSAHGYLGDDTFQVADAMKLVVEKLAELRLLEEILHDVEALVDRAHILQWEYQPAAEHSAAHCRYSLVDDVEQRQTIVLHRSHQFQTSDGESVHAHELILFDARKRRDMVDLRMLGNLQILHDGTAGDDAILKMFHTEAFQRLGLEVSQEFLHRRLLGENPVVEFEGAVFGTEVFLEIILSGTVVEHLFRHEVTHQFLYIIIGSLAGEELTGRNIEEAYAAGSLTEVDGSQEVVLLVVEHVVAHRHTRGNEFGNTALHHLVHLAQSLLALDFQTFLLRIFQLVAYGNSLSCPDEFRQVSIECMMRESRHLDAARSTTIVSSGQGDAENTGSLHRIFAVSFVEVATTEKQQSLGMLGFHLEELSHHRRKTFVIVCHYLNYLMFALYFVRLAKIRKKGGINKGFNLFLNFSPHKTEKVLPCIPARRALIR